jgi:hypothetical protein
MDSTAGAAASARCDQAQGFAEAGRPASAVLTAAALIRGARASADPSHPRQAILCRSRSALTTRPRTSLPVSQEQRLNDSGATTGLPADATIPSSARPA